MSNNERWQPTVANLEAHNGFYANSSAASTSNMTLENVHLLPTTTAMTAMTGTAAPVNEDSYRINIEYDTGNAVMHNGRLLHHNGDGSGVGVDVGEQSIRQQFVTLFNEARTHFVQPTTTTTNLVQQQHEIEGGRREESITFPDNREQNSHWRQNLNQILSLSIIPNSNGTTTTTINDVPINATVMPTTSSAASAALNNQRQFLNRRSSLMENNNLDSTITATTNTRHNPSTSLEEISFFDSDREDNDAAHAHNNNHINNDQNNNNDNNNNDEDAHRFSRMLTKIYAYAARYMPFLYILFIKFVHDHVFSIFNILLLQFIIYQMNKSLCQQISKLAQKNYYTLLRDFIIVTLTISTHFYMAKGVHDLFGLLLAPPKPQTIVSMHTTPSPTAQQRVEENLQKIHVANESSGTTFETTLQITQTLSLSLTLFYVILNDLIIKLLTILAKLLITMLPAKLITPKPRSRVYVAMEYFSQLYRAFAPMREWVTYLGASYKGFEVTSGVIFIIMYLGAKGFEFVERGKSFKKAIIVLINNRDTDRKPTERELNAVDVCPICHDAFTSPVVIECGHIFCEDCVGTWLKREQTCPMCRAKVRDDITFHDGSTSYFYQLF